MITKKNTKFLAQYGSPAHVDELIKTPDDVFGSNHVLDTLVKHHALRDEQVHRFANDPNRHVSHEAKITIASRKNK